LFGDRLHVITEKSAEEGTADTRARLAAAGISVISAEEGRYSLEDVFISVVEKARLAGKVAKEE
jgi:hypothetical protein